MFELYTEKARRVIFFARYEASQAGTPSIESEHLLFGLFRADRDILSACLGQEIDESDVRLEVETQTEPLPPFSTSVDLPISDECKRILAHSSEEAQRLAHQHIGPEHLLLGILREEGCLAARLLSGRGMSLAQVRLRIAALPSQVPAVARFDSGSRADSFRAHMAAPPTPLIRFVDEAGESLTAASKLSILPRIGEGVTLLNDGSPRSYRVLDVMWTFAHSGTGTEHILPEIVIRLAAQA